MGAVVTEKENTITINVKNLNGIEADLNDTPDMLPALSVIACFASGKTIIKNVAHARIKESDRISVMVSELTKLGADIKATDDGLIINQSKLKGTIVNGHKDHRIIMALACAALSTEGPITIENASGIDVSFPNFIEKMNNCGAKIRKEEL
jgi:3-phosphoshikimate 1-carboxyvinyltransferase